MLCSCIGAITVGLGIALGSIGGRVVAGRLARCIGTAVATRCLVARSASASTTTTTSPGAALVRPVRVSPITAIFDRLLLGSRCFDRLDRLRLLGHAENAFEPPADATGTVGLSLGPADDNRRFC